MSISVRLQDVAFQSRFPLSTLTLYLQTLISISECQLQQCLAQKQDDPIDKYPALLCGPLWASILELKREFAKTRRHLIAHVSLNCEYVHLWTKVDVVATKHFCNDKADMRHSKRLADTSSMAFQKYQLAVSRSAPAESGRTFLYQLRRGQRLAYP